MDVVSQPFGRKWCIFIACISLASVYSYAAYGAKGIAEDVHFNSKFDCKTSNKLVLRVSSELQCLHKCAFKKCEFFNYKDVPTESQSAHENCEIFWGTKNERSCSKLMKIDGWKAVVYQNQEVLRNPNAKDTFSSECNNTCSSDVSTNITCGQGNIALRKPSSQSSIHSYAGISFIPGFGNDGNSNGNWEVCSATKNDASPWYRIDLTREAVVEKVSVKSCTNFAQTKIDPFYLAVGNDVSNGGKNNPLCVDEGRLNGKETLFNCKIPLRGRYVSIYLSRTEYLFVCEVSVFEAPFIIKHYSGLCVSLRKSDCRFRLHSNCDEKFTFTANNGLKHLESGKCVVPTAVTDVPGITLTSDCCDGNANFSQTTSLSMMHQNTGKCVHPFGDNINPAIDSDILLANGCNEERFKFKFDYGF